MTTRIGAVSYLNTKPLVHGLHGTNDGYQLSYELPSRLADQLENGELDVALIPTIELFQSSNYRIVSDACIACCGPVRSVKLLSKVPFEEIGAVSMDAGSRTSVALAKILLSERFGIEPIEMGLPINSEWRNVVTDAVLIIGDRAMSSDLGPFEYQWDLGDEWHKETGLPFVFAVWVGSGANDWSRISGLLGNSRDEGLASLSQIATDECRDLDMESMDCESYLRDNLHFTLGEKELEGLKLFQQKALELGLCPPWDFALINEYAVK